MLYGGLPYTPVAGDGQCLVKGMEFEIKAVVGPVDRGVSLRIRSGAIKQSGSRKHMSRHKATEEIELGLNLPSVHHHSFGAELSQSTPEASSNPQTARLPANRTGAGSHR